MDRKIPKPKLKARKTLCDIKNVKRLYLLAQQLTNYISVERSPHNEFKNIVSVRELCYEIVYVYRGLRF